MRAAGAHAENEAIVSCGPAAVTVRGLGADGIGYLEAVLQPSVRVRPALGSPPAPVHVSIESGDPAGAVDQVPIARQPRLLLSDDGAAYTILRHHPAEIVAVRSGDLGGADLLVTARPTDRTMTLGVADMSAAALRSVSRFLKLIIGSQLVRLGYHVLHGSAVSSGGKSVLMLGPTSGGKSTLMFLAVSLAGWSFVTDDLLFLGEEPSGDLVALGWPNRVGVGESVLADHPLRSRFEQASLRRYRTPVGRLRTSASHSWDREQRRRVYCDVDEFLELCDGTGAAVTEPAAVLLPEPDRERRAWAVEQIDCADWPQRFAAGERQRKHITDYLGLLSPWASLKRRADTAVLAGLPVVRAAYGPDVNANFEAFWADVLDATGLPATARHAS